MGGWCYSNTGPKTRQCRSSPEHKMTVKQVRAEVEPEGFRFDQAIETLPQQHIIVFRR